MADETPQPKQSSDPQGFEWKPGRVIPWSELDFVQVTGGGPGGQHVNRTATRVTLVWTPSATEALSDNERERVIKYLSGRLNQKGELRIRSASERRAKSNRDECLDRLKLLVSKALAPRRVRRKTRPTRASREKRKQQKQQRAKIKKSRQKPTHD